MKEHYKNSIIKLVLVVLLAIQTTMITRLCFIEDDSHVTVFFIESVIFAMINVLIIIFNITIVKKYKHYLLCRITLIISLV